jgi:hypothetical protein
MNYSSLTDDLLTYTLRTDPPYVTKIPDIIQQAIIRIYNTANDIGFELIYNSNLPQNDYLIGKPNNWMQTISLSVEDLNNKIYLQERTYEYCKTYLPNSGTIGIPKYYCEVPQGVNLSSYRNWLVVPSADVKYNVEAIYLGIPLFNDTHSTNFLTQNYPNLLLYSCLLEASLFLNNEEMRNKYETMFGKELETINGMNINRTTDRTVTREKS